MNWRLPAFIFLLGLSGCINPYTKFYVDNTGGATNNIMPSDKEPKTHSRVNHKY